MRFLSRLLWIVPAGFFFLNPSLACTSEPEPYQFGAEEMLAAVGGEWTFAITQTDGTVVQAHVDIAQATQLAATTARPHTMGLVRSAQACGSRTLVASASACSDVTDMPLTVSFIDGDPSLSSASLSGRFTVPGLAFIQGELQLTLGPYHIFSGVSADGSVMNANVGSSGAVVVTRP